MRKFFLLIFFPVMAFGSWPMSDGCNWQSSVDVIGRLGNFRKGGGAVLFAPLGQNDCSILFVQGLGGRFREQYAGSIGLGYRWMLEWECVAGVNGFFDVARTNSGHVYYQGGLGLEFIGNCWIARANGYFPSRGDQTLSTRRESVVQIDGNDLISTDTHTGLHEQSYYGFDVEGGRGIELGCGQLWGYGGYYRFDQHGVKAQGGPRFRLEYTWNANPFELTAGGEWEWNDVHGSTLSAVAAIRIPLGGYGARSTSCCDSICRQMGNRVFRNNTIWIDPEERIDLVENVTLPQQIFFVEEGAVGSGTQSDPATFVPGLSQPNGIIFALPEMAPIPATGTYVMSTNEQVHSFGPTGVGVVDLGSGRTLFVSPLSGESGTQAIIEQQNAVSMFQLTGNNTIRGITLDGDGAATFWLTSVADVDRFVLDTAILVNANNVVHEINIAVTDLLIRDSQVGDSQNPGDSTMRLRPTSAPERFVTVIGSTMRGGFIYENEEQFSHFTFKGNTFLDAPSSGAIFYDSPLLRIPGSDTVMSGNLFAPITGTTKAARFRDTSRLAEGGRVRYLISDNRWVDTEDLNSISLNPNFAGGAPAAVKAVVQGNTFSVEGESAVDIGPASGDVGDVFEVLFEGNLGLDVSQQLFSASGISSALVRGNTQSNTTPTAFPGFSIRADDRTLCATLVGNSTNNSGGIQLTNVAGELFQVTAFPELTPLNNDVGVSLTGGPFSNTIFPCAAPPVNPFHGGLIPY